MSPAAHRAPLPLRDIGSEYTVNGARGLERLGHIRLKKD
jgi:hypothetical protein